MRRTPHHAALLTAIALIAQAQSPKPAAAPAPSPGRGTSVRPPLPSVKDLKFPPLGTITTPTVEAVNLPNGMKLFLLEDHELPVVTGVARIRAGNLFDPPDKVGLATITGIAMRSGGTPAKTGDQLDEDLENIAASVESQIDESDATVAFTALKENTDAVMSAFRDVLTQPQFRQDKIDLAKSQLRSGIARRNDDPHGILEREFASLIYGRDNSYGWAMEHATVEHVTRQDVVNFYQRYFFPANVLMAVWGDFDAAQMKGKIENLFAGWNVKQQPVPAFPAVREQPNPGIYLASKGDVTQTFFAIGQLGGELKDKDFAALQVMSDILGGGFRSRLFQRVRTQMGNAYDISANWGVNYDHPGIFQITGSTKSASTVVTVKAILEEVEKIRTVEVTDEELNTAKQTTLNSLVFAFDTRAKSLRRILTYEYFGYPKDFIQQYQKAVKAVTKADVLRVAKEHLHPANFTIMTVGNPKDFGTPLDSLGMVHDVDLSIPEPKE